MTSNQNLPSAALDMSWGEDRPLEFNPKCPCVGSIAIEAACTNIRGESLNWNSANRLLSSSIACSLICLLSKSWSSKNWAPVQQQVCVTLENRSHYLHESGFTEYYKRPKISLLHPTPEEKGNSLPSKLRLGKNLEWSLSTNLRLKYTTNMR